MTQLQEPLHKGLKRLVDEDTGTNVHKLYVTCDPGYIITSWDIVKRDGQEIKNNQDRHRPYG